MTDEQMDIDACIEIAETGSDGYPTADQLNEREPCVKEHPYRPAGRTFPCFEGCICTCGTDFPFPCECHGE